MTSSLARLALLVCGVGAAAILVAVADVPTAADLREIVDRHGAFGSALVIALCALLCLALAPRAAIGVGGGAVFGAVQGFGYVLAGSLLAATIAFGLGRALGADGLRRLAGRRWTPVDEWLSRNGFRAVVMARLMPFVPFGLLSYGLGTTSVRLVTYGPATLLGIAPSTAAYVLLGERATNDPPVALALALGLGALALVASFALRPRRRDPAGVDRAPVAEAPVDRAPVDQAASTESAP